MKDDDASNVMSLFKRAMLVPGCEGFVYDMANGESFTMHIRQVYFNQMMKTGGRSIFTAVHSAFMRDQVEQIEEACKSTLKAGRTMNYKLVANHVMDLSFDMSITVIREPLQRLFSHYRMLIQHKNNNWENRFADPKIDVSYDDPKFLGDGEKPSFEYFLEHFPDKYKIHQLYFYSEDGDIDEAFTNITKNTQIILTEKQQEGLDRLSRKLLLKSELKERNDPSQTTKNIDFKPTEKQIALAKDLLKDEYIFYNRVIDYYNNEE